MGKSLILFVYAIKSSVTEESDISFMRSFRFSMRVSSKSKGPSNTFVLMLNPAEFIPIVIGHGQNYPCPKIKLLLMINFYVIYYISVLDYLSGSMYKLYVV